MNYYTVLFGVSRAFGVAAQLIWDRALGARKCVFLGLKTRETDRTRCTHKKLSSAPSRTQPRPSKTCSRTSSEFSLGSRMLSSEMIYRLSIAYLHLDSYVIYSSSQVSLELTLFRTTTTTMTDVRALLKAKRQEVRINHPLASYNSANQLRCVACGTVIKQSTSWEGHIGSKAHRTNAARLREQRREAEKEELALKRKMEEAELDDDSETEKKKPRTDGEGEDEDIISAPPPPAKPSTSFPTDFFSDPSKASAVRSHDSEDEEGEDENTTPASAPAPAPAAIDLEWEKFQREVVSAPDTRETYERATVFAEPELAMETPEGFPMAQVEAAVEKTEREEAMDEEALRRRKAEEERELIMDRLMDEERAQEEADARVTVLKSRLETLRKQRELLRAAGKQGKTSRKA